MDRTSKSWKAFIRQMANNETKIRQDNFFMEKLKK